MGVRVLLDEDVCFFAISGAAFLAGLPVMASPRAVTNAAAFAADAGPPLFGECWSVLPFFVLVGLPVAGVTAGSESLNVAKYTCLLLISPQRRECEQKLIFEYPMHEHVISPPSEQCALWMPTAILSNSAREQTRAFPCNASS